VISNEHFKVKNVSEERRNFIYLLWVSTT